MSSYASFRATSLLLTVVVSACAAPAPVPQRASLTAPTPPTTASAAPVASKPPFVNHGGMWLPSQMPERSAELKQLGLAIDPALLADPKSSLLASIVNLNGCSASFVSKEGLVVTNHHCAIGALQRNSTPKENLLETGILAKTRAEERSSGPAARLSVLSKMTDVTTQVRPALAKVSDDLARRLELDRLQKELLA